jgi:23S rRNA (adenine2503-C2)-methyltransferase
MAVNLLGLDKVALESYLESIGEKKFRAVQLIKWIHEYQVIDFTQMTNLGKGLQQKLADNCIIEAPIVSSTHVASDHTRKWLFQIAGGSLVETVFIPEATRGTLCISSQVGCALNCTFCSTARQGFNRNLQVAEIVGQVWQAKKILSSVSDSPLSTKITNIVFMGMGEPLLNFDNVAMATRILRDMNAYQIPRRRLTVSTSGVVPAMERLVAEMDVALAVSLHAPNDELRNELVPINKKYNIALLLAACKKYTEQNQRYFTTFEYVMLNGVNDLDIHARQLAKLLANVKCKINLIPFNPFPGAPYLCSSAERIQKFAAILNQAGFVATTRKTRGDDIDAACGQLVGRVIDKTKRQERFKNLLAAAGQD